MKWSEFFGEYPNIAAIDILVYVALVFLAFPVSMFILKNVKEKDYENLKLKDFIVKLFSNTLALWGLNRLSPMFVISWITLISIVSFILLMFRFEYPNSNGIFKIDRFTGQIYYLHNDSYQDPFNRTKCKEIIFEEK